MRADAKKYHLVYPHQLFEEALSFPQSTRFLLIEDPLFFGDRKYPRRFHKQKIVLHRASMRAFADRLNEKGFRTEYLEYGEYPDPVRVAGFLRKQGAGEVTMYDPVDFVLEKRARMAFASFRSFTLLETPNFLTPLPVVHDFFRGKKNFLMNSFYIFQRRRLGILVENGAPLGGKWSFDAENRKRLPQGLRIPPPIHFKKNKYVEEAVQYANQNFKQNPGRAEEFDYPIDRAGSKRLLADFMKKRLAGFGAYEDAISEEQVVLFHSKLSAPLNIGLLSPSEIIARALLMEAKVPRASLEGFIRQIIGWREFMRAVYVLRGSEIRRRNVLNHKNNLPDAWYGATTGIAPIDATIRKVLKHAYCHHIERLMILGNFMLLLKITPDHVYGWFMDLFIDAYDWVMVPNVYAMSQFADGGTITTKPYFSSSNYVRKMSDYKKGPWCEIWDSLFYNFLSAHRSMISRNPRLNVLLKHLDRLSKEKRASMMANAKKYI